VLWAQGEAGVQPTIKRVGVQRTYVFYKNGMESIVLRPGFSGNVDEFGMLIPFPSPPAIRKLPDNVFEHITAAIDPPEVVIDLRRQVLGFGGGFGGGGGAGGGVFGGSLGFVQPNEVRVIRQEAVGMYEVAVLAAGSAESLKRWMDDHNYAYPSGMDIVCPEYIQKRWCFVAVKTKVKQKAAAQPKPGQRQIDNDLPQGASFDGHVQAMGFRFRTRQLVVPMRLSVHNSTNLHNVVYLLSDTPSMIRNIPKEFVRRQVSGEKLFDQMTQPLPLKIIGGTIDNVPVWRRRGLAAERDPHPHNGVAAELFASDIVAANSRRLESRTESYEKNLLKINEALDLRGKEVDADVRKMLARERARLVLTTLKAIENMTLTVIDGDFPREVLARENLTFVEYHMPLERSDREHYDANKVGQSVDRPGTLFDGSLETIEEDVATVVVASGNVWMTGVIGLFAVGGIMAWRFPTSSKQIVLSCGVLMVASSWLVTAVSSADETPSISVLVRRLGNPSLVEKTVDQIVTLGKAAVPAMIKQSYSRDTLKQGWAIVCLARIGGDQAVSQLRRLHVNQAMSPLARTWSAAGMIKAVRSDEELDELSQLVALDTALSRPFVVALRQRLNKKEPGDSIDTLLMMGSRAQFLRQVLADELSTKSARPIVAAFLQSEDRSSLLKLATQYSGVGSPFVTAYWQRLKKEEGFGTVESQLVAASHGRAIARSIGQEVISAGSQPLLRAMLQAKNQNIRRQAAAYLASLAGTPGQAEIVAADIVKVLTFEPASEEPPWHGGPLFVPGIQWTADDGKKLVGNLIRWYVWADEKEKTEVRGQINNNLRSNLLSRVVGYQQPVGNATTSDWLKSWQHVVGDSELQRLLAEQHLEEKYSSLFDN
jgi:hypothetical protein